MLSYYEILQINKNSTDAEIKKAYRKLCKILHPDLHNNSKEANVIFNLLHEAYETLSNPEKRRRYNPNQHSSSTFDISNEKYDEIITGYKKIVKDYERIIKTKNQREKDLLKEIRELKAENNRSNTADSIRLESEKTKEFESGVKSKESKPNISSGKILPVVFWIIVVAIIILIAMIPVGWWIIIGIISLPLYFIILVYKSLS